MVYARQSGPLEGARFHCPHKDCRSPQESAQSFRLKETADEVPERKMESFNAAPAPGEVKRSNFSHLDSRSGRTHKKRTATSWYSHSCPTGTLTSGIQPKEIDELHTHTGEKLDGRKICYDSKLLTSCICIKTRRVTKTTGDKDVFGGEKQRGHLGACRRETLRMPARHGIESKPRGRPSAIASPSAPTKH